MRQRSGDSSEAHDEVRPGTKRDRHADFADVNKSNNEYMLVESCNHTDARALVEQELQKSIMGLKHCHQIRPLHEEESASKRRMGRNRMDGDEIAEMDMNWGGGMDIGFDHGEECKMSEEEYLELIRAVTEELEQEGTLAF